MHASEKNNELPFKLGTAIGQCDRCGDWTYLNNLKLEAVTGYRVCKPCFDPENPLLTLRVPKESNRVTFTRLPQEEESTRCNLRNSVGIVGYGVVGCMVIGRDGYYAGV